MRTHLHNQILGALSLFLVVAVIRAEIDDPARYNDYFVYNVTLGRNETKLRNLLKDLELASVSIIFQDDIAALGKPVNVIVAQHKQYDFEKVLNHTGAQYHVLSRDLQQELDRNPKSLKLNQYHKINDTYRWLQLLANDYPYVISLKTVGRTFESRKILGVKISFPADDRPTKDAIFIEAGMNGNEWIAPATALYIINELLTSDNKTVQQVARDYDWHIIPHANPDGYSYTHTVDRLWRKTRKPYGKSHGVNMNLNFDHNWGMAGTSNETCSNRFAGNYTMSEAEVNAIGKYALNLENAFLFISLHAFGQRLEYPYSDVPEAPSNVKDLKEICSAAITALANRYGTKYNCGTRYEMPYPESGTFMDWIFEKKNELSLAFTYNLRPSRRKYETGYQLAESDIVPTAQETLDSLIAMIEKAKNLGYVTWGPLSVENHPQSVEKRPRPTVRTTTPRDELF